MVKKVIFLFVGFYKFFISPFLGENCRFYPSCSQFTLQAVEKHGSVKGVFLGIKRILKCHPFSEGGIDLP